MFDFMHSINLKKLNENEVLFIELFRKSIYFYKRMNMCCYFQNYQV